MLLNINIILHWNKVFIISQVFVVFREFYFSKYTGSLIDERIGFKGNDGENENQVSDFILNRK